LFRYHSESEVDPVNVDDRTGAVEFIQYARDHRDEPGSIDIADAIKQIERA
jgi:hypothetical protein